MHVHTSNGIEKVDFNKILEKLTRFSQGLSKLVDPDLVAQKTIQNMVDNISTKELDELSARISANLVSKHPDYGVLGARILMSRLHRQLDIPRRTFSQNIDIIYNNKINGIKSKRISQDVYDFIQRNAQALESIINYASDFEDYDYIALSGFMKRGLEQINGEMAEAPSQMFLRIAIGLNIYQPRSQGFLDEFSNFAGFKPEFSRLKNMTDQQRLENIKDYYQLLVTRSISVPGPIILHAGSEHNQMSSCYLQYCGDSLTSDTYSIDGKVGGIMKAMTQLAAEAKGGGGVAIAISDIRANGSAIRSTNGKSNGALPFMKMFDATIGSVNQSGKRAGTCAVYMEPWHGDILEFLDAADHFTIEEKRCKNLFYGLYANDVFFNRLVSDKASAKWTLFDPAVVANYLEKPLSDYYGDEFKEKYEYLESLGIGKTLPLMEIWSRVLKLFQITGNPYILNKDAINLKSNQQNIGTVKSSNLCTEITLASSESETGVCVLTSMCISRYVDKTKPDGVDYDKLIMAARLVTRHLNSVIDLQYYPTPETRNSCLASRAIGVGLQGLADLYAILRLEFDEQKARDINKRVYECIYFGCMWESMELAKIEGTYHYFQGSPVSKGILQYDMWGINQGELFLSSEGSDLESLKGFNGNPWDELKKQIAIFGIRNSEVTALAPTASSSIRMQNNEMHEPFTRMVYVRQYIGGSVQVINKYLVDELVEIGLWNEEMFEKIVYLDGSIQAIEQIPLSIRSRYKNVYETDWKALIDMMADRSPFISQSSSFNHYTTYEEAGPTAFTQKLIYSWKKGLKTLSYYMHTEVSSGAKKELGMRKTVKADPVESTSYSKENSPFIQAIKAQGNMEVKIGNGDQYLDENGEICEFCSS